MQPAAPRAEAPPGVDTSSRFGFQWDRYRELFPHYRRQFEGWIAPLRPEELAGKDVLDAGCGMGRNAYWIAQLGARSVHAIDASALAVSAARELLGPFPQVRVERMAIERLEPRAAYDVCLSIGVVHHLADPRAAVERLVSALRPGGRLVLWLYALEGNERYARALLAVHPLLRRLSPRLIHALGHALTAPLVATLRAVRPRSPYLAELSRLPYWHVHLIVVDQLVPEIVRFYRRREVEELVAGLPLREVAIHHNRGYSWTVLAEKAPEARG